MRLQWPAELFLMPSQADGYERETLQLRGSSGSECTVVKTWTSSKNGRSELRATLGSYEPAVIHEVLWCQAVKIKPGQQRAWIILDAAEPVVQLNWSEPKLSSTQLNSTQLNSTQRASMDAGVKHLSVHIYLFTSVCQVLQSTWFAYWSVADSGQVRP